MPQSDSINTLTKQKQELLRLYIILIVILVVLFIINISLGSVRIPIQEVANILIGKGASRDAWNNILIHFRLPKALTAVMVGAGLGISGLLMQTLFRNPMAGPFVLGISSGASLGVAVAILAGMSAGAMLTQVGIIGDWFLTLAASTGAFLILLVVVAVSARVRDSMSLLIIGLMFGSTTAAIVSVLQFFSRAESVQAYLIWTFGSLGGLTWQELNVFIPVVIIGLIIAFMLSKNLNALLLGDNYAQSMGVNLKTTRFIIILSTSLLAGTITAFCGPIAFIGIAIPHLTRLLFNTANHKTLFFLVTLCGAILMLTCDIIAQVPGHEYTLPINAVTSIIGAPIVIWLVLRKGNISKSFTG
ncbi:iron chelate uptake ABC transporter family permease subunit [Bacteroidota bacterium]